MNGLPKNPASPSKARLENYIRIKFQKVLPAVYDDSLSYIELLSKVIGKINGIISNVNQCVDGYNDLVDLFNALYYYVYTFFDNLNVQDEINNKLQEMLEDGTLYAALNRGMNVAAKIKYMKEGLTPSIHQGMTKMGAYIYLSGYTVSNGLYTGYIDVLTLDGTISKTITITNSELSSLCNDGRYIYASIARTADGDEARVNTVVKLDPNNDYSYEIIPVNGIEQVAAIAFDNSWFYIMDEKQNIYRTTDLSTDLDLMFTLPNIEGIQHRQTMFLLDGNIMVIYSNFPQIGRYTPDGNFLGFYTLPASDSYGVLPIAELESGYVEDGIIYVSSNAQAQSNGEPNTVVVYELSTTGDVPLGYRVPSSLNFIVDNEANWEYPDGSTPHPFTSLACALFATTSRNLRLNLSGRTYPGVYTVNGVAKMINGTVGALNCGINSDVKLNGITFLGTDAQAACFISGINSIVKLTNCIIDEDVKIPVMQIGGGSTLNMYGLVNNPGVPLFTNNQSSSLDGFITTGTNSPVGITQRINGLKSDTYQRQQVNETISEITKVEGGYQFKSSYLKWAYDNSINNYVMVMIITDKVWTPIILNAARVNGVHVNTPPEYGIGDDVNITRVSDGLYQLNSPVDMTVYNIEIKEL